MKYWDNLQKREKQVVIWGSVALLPMLIYVLMIEPLVSNASKMREELLSKSDDLVWMQNAANQVQQLTALQVNKSGISPLKIINKVVLIICVYIFLHSTE